MQNRRDVFSVPGGDTIQMMKTKEALEKKYEDVSIDISTELKPNLDSYDLVHLFNVTRVHETYTQLQNAKRQNKPVVVTPIYHSLVALGNYEKNGRVGLLKLLNTLIPNKTFVEGLKNLIRTIKDPKQFQPTLKQLEIGYVEQQRLVLEEADILFPIAKEEYNCFKEELNISHDRYLVVPNGVDYIENNDLNKKEIDVHGQQITNYILCVARIENRKNQIGLINALKNTNYKIIFVGAKNPKQKKYFQEFIKLIDNKNYFYLGKVDHDKIMNLYKNARVHVLPSWFEVVPLVDIEAALSGCEIVTSKNSYIKEYLGDNAFYCDPSNSESIKENVALAFKNQKNDIELFNKMKSYKWENVIDNSYIGYKEVLKSKNEEM